MAVALFTTQIVLSNETVRIHPQIYTTVLALLVAVVGSKMFRGARYRGATWLRSPPKKFSAFKIGSALLQDNL